MEPLDAAAVAALLVEIGKRLELTGDLPFKARAYYNAAENLLALTTPLPELIARNKLRTIPGVGEAIAEKIIKLHLTGTHPTLERLRAEVPAGLLDLLRIPGLGAKKVALLHSALKIASMSELEEACRTGRVKDCKGLGVRTQENILRGIEFIRQRTGLLLIDRADERLRAACELLAKTHPEWHSLVPAGATRRGCEVVEQLVIVAEGAPSPAGDARWQTIDFQRGIAVHVAEPSCYGLALLWNTGSAAHLEALQARARDAGLKLDESGLSQGERQLDCATEQDLYGALGLPFIEPELREGRGEVEAAAKGALPKLVKDSDIRGVLHCHTVFSDGVQSVGESAEEVRELGLQYFGVADHSRTAAYAGGLQEAELREQQQLIAKLNAEYRAHDQAFRIFAGIESDILEDGSLDYPDAVLKDLDFVVASVHSRFGLDRKTQTERIVKAIANPYTTILGHPTGRLLLQREEYSVDVEQVLQACAEHGVVLEINANPHRLDLDWRWHARALELGCLLSINPDAHAPAELGFMSWGVKVARKGGVPAVRVLNCMALDEIAEFLAGRRKRRR